MIIREEVTMAVRKEMRTESVQPNKVVEEQQQPKYVERPVAKKPAAPKFKNAMLNELLDGVTPAPQDYATAMTEEWPTMNYGSAQARMGSPRVMQHMPQEINAAPDGISIEAIEATAPEVAAALTKDYSALMKAINAKKGK